MSHFVILQLREGNRLGKAGDTAGYPSRYILMAPRCGTYASPRVVSRLYQPLGEDVLCGSR